MFGEGGLGEWRGGGALVANVLGQIQKYYPSKLTRADAYTANYIQQKAYVSLTCTRVYKQKKRAIGYI